MKKIAVLVHSLTVEYALNVLSGVSNFFSDKDVMLFVAQTKNPHYLYGLFDYHCWANTELLFSSEIDGYVIITGSYTSHIQTDSLAELLKKIGNRPVVSISQEMKLPNCYYTKSDSVKVYEDVIGHFKNKHGCKRFAFMSANSLKSEEALERYENFRNALKKHNIEFDEKLLFDANFKRFDAFNIISEKYHCPEDIDFDALFCANDLMALGSQEALQKIGVKIPEDVKIFGFDNTSHALEASPKLSTIDQDIVHQGFVGAEILFDILNGKNISRKVIIPVTPIYRQSCGCIPLENNDSIYCNSKDEILRTTKEQTFLNKQNSNYFNFLAGIDNIYTLFDLAKSSDTITNVLYTIKFMLQKVRLPEMAVYFFESPVTITNETEYKMPEKAFLSMHVNLEKNINDYFFEKESEYYSYANDIIHGLSPEKGSFFMQPIFSGEKLYGYLICKINDQAFSICSVYMKIIIDALAKSYEYTESLSKNQKLSEENEILQKRNSNLNVESKTDSLTQILNRRGFMEVGQKSLDIAKQSNTNGLVIFFDMDGLKVINDTYGHEMGDKALISLAKALSNSFRANDVVGRIGGDEFAAIAFGLSAKQKENLCKRIKKMCESEVKLNNYPFELSCSAGITPFSAKKADLESLLKKSDKLLYEEKKLKHAKINKEK